MAASPTLEDVAREVGVSRATASRAIAQYGRVSEETRDLVAAAAARLGYVPNRAARSLVTRSTDVIALVVAEPDRRIFTDPFFGSAIAGIVSVLDPTPKQLVLAMRTHAEGNDSLRSFLGNSQVDGVVVLSHHASDDFSDILQDRGIPAAFVGRPHAEDCGIPFVDLDNRQGGRLAAEHLITRGASRLATITGPSDMSAAIDRLTGWREGLVAAGIEEVACVEAAFTQATGAAAAERIMTEHPDVDGIFVASDMMAVGAIRRLARLGVSVPGDVRLMGFDDAEGMDELDPPLTTLTNPAEAMTKEATQMVLDLIAGREVASPIVFEPELVVRGSS